MTILMTDIENKISEIKNELKTFVDIKSRCYNEILKLSDDLSIISEVKKCEVSYQTTPYHIMCKIDFVHKLTDDDIKQLTLIINKSIFDLVYINNEYLRLFIVL